MIWDPEWNMYKTYPWWIAKRNDVDLVCDAICGSTMALSKKYLDGAEDKEIAYRCPFSYERYKQVPIDAVYATLWF